MTGTNNSTNSLQGTFSSILLAVNHLVKKTQNIIVPSEPSSKKDIGIFLTPPFYIWLLQIERIVLSSRGNIVRGDTQARTASPTESFILTSRNLAHYLLRSLPTYYIVYLILLNLPPTHCNHNILHPKKQKPDRPRNILEFRVRSKETDRSLVLETAATGEIWVRAATAA